MIYLSIILSVLNPRSLFTNTRPSDFVPRLPAPGPHPLHQKIDSWVIVVSSSSAFIPFTELPLLLRRGLHTATE